MNEKYKKHYLKYKNKYKNLQKKKLQGGNYTTALLIPLLIIIALSIAGYIYRPNILKMFKDYKTRQEIENLNSSRTSIVDDTLTIISRKTSSEGKKNEDKEEEEEIQVKQVAHVAQNSTDEDLKLLHHIIKLEADKDKSNNNSNKDNKSDIDLLTLLIAMDANNNSYVKNSGIDEANKSDTDLLILLIAMNAKS